MKILCLLFLMLFASSSSLLGQATTFLEQENNINKLGISRVSFEFRQEEKMIVIPFYGFVSRANRKGTFYPRLSVLAKDSVKSIKNVKFTLYEDSGRVLISYASQREVDLNDILDYRSLGYDFKKSYTMKNLVERGNTHNLMVTYEFTVQYFNGHSESFYFDKKILHRIKERKFKPML